MSWLSGADGPLIMNGGVLTLTVGTIKDYSSITLSNGAIVTTDQAHPADGWLIIGCVGDLTMSGGSYIQANYGSGTPGTYSTTAPDGTSLSYILSDYNDAGGGGDDLAFIGIGGQQANGNGGGGAGQSNGGNATATRGGNGGATGGSPGGLGATVLGESGLDGNDTGTIGTGGGGGSRGFTGQGIYIKVVGNVSVTNVGGGIISVSGGDGGWGGNGGTGTSHDGGGGGGGSGGSGGKIVFKRRVGVADPSGVFEYFGGAAGTGGVGDSSGGDGDVGADGSYVSSTFVNSPALQPPPGAWWLRNRRGY